MKPLGIVPWLLSDKMDTFSDVQWGKIQESCQWLFGMPIERPPLKQECMWDRTKFRTLFTECISSRSEP